MLVGARPARPLLASRPPLLLHPPRRGRAQVDELRRDYIDTAAWSANPMSSDSAATRFCMPFDDDSRMPAPVYREYLYGHVVQNARVGPPQPRASEPEEVHDFENDDMGA